MLNPINKTIELGDGRTITIETGKLAKQADGAVTVRMTTPCCSPLFVPLKTLTRVLTSCRCK